MSYICSDSQDSKGKQERNREEEICTHPFSDKKKIYWNELFLREVGIHSIAKDSQRQAKNDTPDHLDNAPKNNQASKKKEFCGAEQERKTSLRNVFVQMLLLHKHTCGHFLTRKMNTFDYINERKKRKANECFAKLAIH
jgi:hypothetical protein